MNLGDPMDQDTDLGPLATEAIRDELAGQVRRSEEAGASILTGGTIPDRPVWFYYEHGRCGPESLLPGDGGVFRFLNIKTVAMD